MKTNDHSIIAEQAVIGSALITPECITGIKLTPEEFLVGNHQEIYAEILRMISFNEVVDVLTVSSNLKRLSGRDWLPLLGEMASKTPSAEHLNVVAYANVIQKEYNVRKAIVTAKELISKIQDNADLSTIDTAIKKLMEISQESKNYDHGVKTMCKSAADELDKAFETHLNGRTMGVTTGLTKLDSFLGGFHKSDLVVIPARPAMGKTALMLNMALNSKSKCGIISSEQASNQLGLRCISIEGSASSSKMRSGDLHDADWARITAGVNNLLGKEIWVNDKPDITIQEIQRKGREWVFKYGIEILFVDYIQRINTSTRHENKIRQVEEVTVGLKNLAKELNIPIVGLAQVNRACEARENSRPHMGDVADASIIEKECDVMIILYRDEVYNQDENSINKGIAELNIAKNRHGPTGTAKVSWRGEYMQFRNLYEVV